MKKNMMTNLLMAAAMIALPALASTKSNNLKPMEERVRHELVMLPWTSIYDNLSFRVDGDTVTLFGATVRPTIRSSAENVVKRVEGVHNVINNIEVLPVSPMDDRIRIATARAIYGYPALQRYSLGSQPSIRIIVKNGNVSLQGVVATEFDRNVAFMRANGVFGAFAVKNELRVDSN